MKAFNFTAFLGFTLLSYSISPAQDIQLLMAGHFHGKVVSAQSGEIWYGLYNEGETYRLVRTTIKVEAVHDAEIDEQEGEKTGKRVSAEHEGRAIFMVRGIDGIEEREVRTLFNGKKFFFPGEIKYFGQGWNRIYVIAFGDVQKPEPPYAPGFHNYSIQLLDGARDYYPIYQYSVLPTEEEIPNLIWAGDIDNDGKIDMFWNMATHYLVFKYTLYLSSLALKGELLHKSAEFITHI